MHTGHGMHRYYNETLKTMEERINAAIEGVEEPGSQLSPVRAKYEGYMGWLEQPAVLCLRFEDLILDRQNALDRLLDYLEQRGFTPVLSRAQEIEILQQAIAPKKSGTFRKGQPGNWREHFSEANKAFFKEQTGDLLFRLGYETERRLVSRNPGRSNKVSIPSREESEDAAARGRDAQSRSLGGTFATRGRSSQRHRRLPSGDGGLKQPTSWAACTISAGGQA